jgi:dTDP-4-amino-4,6-dideoxygalactose transaminase
LNQIPGFRKYLTGDDNFPGAQFVADRILTLPTHPYVTEDDIKKIVSVINGLVSGKR